MVINNKRLARLMRPSYSVHQISDLISFLQEMRTLDFNPLPNGLFPAAAFGKDMRYTGYSYIWVRDNIHIAHAHYAVGNIQAAQKTVATLMQYFTKHRKRFIDIITGKADPADPMNRPHIRFLGSTLEEVDEKWAHAQNDALGYFLWMFCKLANAGKLSPSQDDLQTLVLFPLYFDAIQYWADEDSGHWEETKKMSASSIGVVIAGLQELGKLISKLGNIASAHGTITPQGVELLIQNGRATMTATLPAECIQPDPVKRRLCDGALLFLVFPLQVVEVSMGEKILENTITHLQGEFGIRRYLGDSYWAPDYKKKLKPRQRTVDFSDALSSRDQLLPAVGQEAQWCIFDPIISCIYGTQFKAGGGEAVLAKQVEYLNRSLGQITHEAEPEVPPFRCPELYYLEDDRYVPNDHVPLLWTQANLMLSLKTMKESCILVAQTERKAVLT